MKDKIVTILLLIVMVTGYSCSDKVDPNGTGTQDEQIQLSGLLTRADGDIYPNLHLKAVVATDTSEVYIPETPFTVPTGLEETVPNDIVFTDGSPYYPLGNNLIRFFAYSRPLDSEGRMQLTSGTALANDAILSNQGFWEGGIGLTPEQEGTPGSAKQPATVLQFRHVMTKIDVIIKVDSTESPYVDPIPREVHLGMEGMRSKGTYRITNAAPVPGNESNASVASNRTGNYILREGTNYVVPTGRDLMEEVLTSLRIDDYTATDADLTALSITNLSGKTEAPIVSGYAYTLTLLIRRLKVESILLELVEWDATEKTPEDIGYEPYELALDLGEYDVNEPEDWVTKLVIWSSDGKEYVGEPDVDDRSIMNFVTLPTGAVDSVAVYTQLGMLIRMEPDSYVYNPPGSTLTLELSEGGMRLEDPGAAPGASNPYLIYTPVQVFNMSKDLAGNYKQMADLDVDRLTYEGRALLEPLGTFTGYYDGNGYNINNLMITGSALVKRNEGVIKNLNIDSGRINAEDELVAGSICAVNNGVIVACINGARITGATGIAGGICGVNDVDGVIIACVNTGDVEERTTLGGICGRNDNPDTHAFVACVNTGLMAKTASTIGGIIGESVTTSNELIYNSFWLVGTAAYIFGGTELAVGNGDVGLNEVTALSPEKMRDDVSGASDVEPTLDLLNIGLQSTIYGTGFTFVLDQDVTGVVWPVPVKK